MQKPLREYMKLWIDCITEVIYPSNIYCLSCGNLIDKTRPYALCDDCLLNMNWANQRTCDKCGKILRSGYYLDLCIDCSEITHVFEKGFASVEYGRVEREMIHNLKYKDKPYFGRKIAQIMFDRIEPEGLKVDLLIPVPMNKKKERKRGYNQAEILAHSLAKLMALPYVKGLIRDFDTEAMSHLGAEDRRENIKGAFSVKKGFDKRIKGKKILLIDDVFTTGSTVDECAEVLLAAGADKIYVMVFAAGANLPSH